jgi:hypothetical protein
VQDDHGQYGRAAGAAGAGRYGAQAHGNVSQRYAHAGTEQPPAAARSAGDVHSGGPSPGAERFFRRGAPQCSLALQTRASRQQPGNERLYEAYSQLHSMANDFDKPFDSPAILVVGYQTDGKSALVEALSACPRCSAPPAPLSDSQLPPPPVGFQFNHVGGGTKTRRPIAIHMTYSALCVEPRCYLLKEEAVEEEMSLQDLQDYIESENRRLDAEHGFWAKEIVVKIEYKCVWLGSHHIASLAPH